MWTIDATSDAKNHSSTTVQNNPSTARDGVADLNKNQGEKFHVIIIII